MVSYFANIMGDQSIDQREYARKHPSSDTQLVMTFPFVDLYLNTTMFFAMPRCVLIALEPQSTKQCYSFLLNLHPTLQNQRSQDGCIFLWLMQTTRYEVLPYITCITSSDGRYKRREDMLQLKCIHCQCALWFHEQVNKCIHYTNTEGRGNIFQNMRTW